MKDTLVQPKFTLEPQVPAAFAVLTESELTAVVGGAPQRIWVDY